MTPWPNRVLAPVDFSEPSAAALRFASRLVEGARGSLLVLHAHSWEAPAYFTESRLASLDEQFKLSMREADHALEQFISRECPGCQADRRIVDARPVDGILQTAKEYAADLIVAGTHGRSGIRRFLLGSVAERILREASIPIVTVRPSLKKPPGQEPVKKILCPVNESASARQALETAASLAVSLGAELNVLHVAEPLAQGAKPDICNWLPESERRACKVQELAAAGDPAEQILRLAEESSADLLVIGARHRAFADATVIGTTTIRVVRHSPVPVLTVISNPPRHGA